MKKTVLFLYLCSILCGSLSMRCSAQEQAYHWYCVHVKDHLQPRVGTELAFVEDLDGYYIDHRHPTVQDAEKVIYLTFDAGYENGNVTKILDILKEESVPAAFFILGHIVTEHTELVQRMVADGHTVCNHSVRHKDMSSWSDEAFLEELKTLENLYQEHVGGSLSPYYRPPEGCFSRQNLICAKENGYRTVFWSFAYPDWDNQKQMTPAQAKKIIMENIHNGEVMLLHPTSETNVAVLKDVISELKAQGYRFGTLDELTDCHA